MAAAAPPADQAADLLQKLSLDSQPKTLEVPEATKKASAIPFGSVDAADVPNGQIPLERSITPLLQDFVDPTMCYLPNGYPSTAYYYGGYDGPINEWDDYSRYVNPDGVEMSPGVYGENGSLMYHHGYGYAPYGPYSPAGSPVPTMGHDGQLYGPQHYQYPAPYYQPPTPPSGPYTPNQPTVPRGDVSTSVASEQVPLPVETAKGNSNGIANGNVDGNNTSGPLRPSYQNSSLNSNGSYLRGVLPGGIPASGYQDPRFGFDGMRSAAPWLDSPIFSDGQPRPVTSSSVSSTVSHISNGPSGRNLNLRPVPHLMGLHHPRPTSGMNPAPGFMNRMYPNNRMYGSNTVRGGPGFGSNGYDSRANGRGWLAVDSKYKNRGRGNGFFGYGNENMDGLNELNRGPRAKSFKNQKGFVPITLAVKGQNLPSNVTDIEKDKENSSLIADGEQYNRADFPEKHSNAKFFIIKSYSEDDVHKSIKYGVWASTPNGNKKLDAGYQEAQEKSGGCPLFLFFSVNTSGQFVGLAEMVGPVDFNKNVEHWQQDKWNGCFPVKWHIVKDVPNGLLKHITLENNENKPVTNSRDTQEVKFEQGLQMLKIFKDHSSKTCILDDFGFYEARQKTMQEKRAKQQQFQKQVWDGKSTHISLCDEKDKEMANGKPRLQKSLEVVSAMPKEPVVGAASAVIQSNGEHKISEENESVAGAGDAPKGAKSAVTEKRVVANGVANGC
ncbi:YTH domain-containing protein ECT4-like [Macadamia integrifolia]|uniref:YTH domain-containing protein ECT4-like n=1 Tax=Macadamia integrifolia TaxID=60698 RepID=UPI001C4FA2EB|nr:YTH domain-containing protein ECT4-like [Macadamia integrifolia]